MRSYIEVTGPDGKIFEFPEGTSQDAMKDALARFYNAAPSVPPSEELGIEGTADTAELPWYQRAAKGIQRTATNTASQLRDELSDPQTYVEQLPAAGSTVGMAVGMPLGPVGMAGGSALGAAAGKAIQGAIRGKDATTQAAESLKEATYDLGFSALGPLATGTGRRLFGLANEASKATVEAATRSGIDLSIMAATGNTVVKKSWPTVLGVFPFTSGGMQKNVGAALSQTETKLANYLDEVAPTVTLWKLGEDFSNIAEHRFSKVFMKEASILYENFYNRAKELGDPKVFPSTPITDAVAAMKAERTPPHIVERVRTEASSILDASGRPMREAGLEEVRVPLPDPTEKKFTEYVYKLENLDDNLSALELRTLEKELNALAKSPELKGVEDHRFAILKKGIEESKALSENPELAELINEANTYFAQGRKIFETSSARHFVRVDKDVFTPTARSKAGSLTEQDLGRVLLRQKSPQAVKELRDIAGPDQVKRMARLNLDDAVERSLRSLGDSSREKVFSFTAFGERLNLGNRSNREYWEELLKGTGVSLESLEDLIKVGKAYEKIPLRDPSTFVARRLMLGGASAFAVDDPQRLIKYIPALVLIRWGGNALTSPRMSGLLKSLMDDSVSAENKRVLTGKLFQYMSEERELTEDDHRLLEELRKLYPSE